nr:hypothetical protein [Muribaculum intestinale]
MNNYRLLTGVLLVALSSGGVCAYGQSRQVVTIDQLFEFAETNSVQLRPSLEFRRVLFRSPTSVRACRLAISAMVLLPIVAWVITRRLLSRTSVTACR